MKDRVQDRTQRKRRDYVKPELKFIDLVADQVMSVGCKTSGAGSGGFGGCTVNNCVSSGS